MENVVGIDRLRGMVVHLVKELIESLLTNKFPQSLMTYDLMYYRVRYIGGIYIVW